MLETSTSDSWFTPVCFTHFWLNIPSYFTLLLNLRSLILGLKFLIWLSAWTLPGEYNSQGSEKSWEPELRQSPCALRICSHHGVYLHLFVLFLVLPTNATITRTIEEEKNDTKTNNRSSNLNGSNVYDLCLIKRLCSTACDSEFDYPWQNIWDGDDVENLPSVTTLVTTN